VGRVQMRPVAGPAMGFACVLAVLGTLAATGGLGVAGWTTGLACGAAACGLLFGALRRRPGAGLGPADRVTLTRTVLSCGIAAVVADSFDRPVPVPVLVALAATALVLDVVDGRVARLTGTVSAMGARFDLEADAFLIAVLTVYVAPAVGWWVLGIGAARYVFLLAGWVFPWLRGSAPPRYWCKVVAAVQGIALTLVATGTLPDGLAVGLLAVALVLLAESFGHEAWDLWRVEGRPASRVRAAVSAGVTVLAGVTVWAALVAPNHPGSLAPGAFLRIPLEGVLVLGLAAVLGRRSRRALAALFGLALGLLVVVKVLDLGFAAVLDRPFDPAHDYVYLGSAVGVLGDSIGPPAARAAAVGAALLVAAVLVGMPLAVGRLARLVASHRRTSTRALGALGLAWAMCALAGLGFAPAAHVATAGATGLVVDEVRQVRADLRDRGTFSGEIAADGFAATRDDRLLRGLRGKDVVLAFVESYGRVAVQGTSFSPRVDAVLDAGTRRLDAAGFSSRSAFLTSPTFGAASWLAHSTLQSGLWVDSQQRYDQLLGEDRLTLSDAFGRAGWRTVSDVPSDTRDWPEGRAFYHFDEMYDARNVGYRGPAFGYAQMPDQFTLEQFRRRELAPADRPPVMAEIDLVSSHHPWAPLPQLVDWDRVGDGSVFDGMPARGDSADEVFRDAGLVRAAYGQSIVYTLRTLISFLRHHPDPDLVLILLGDHQPHSYVTGAHPGHDVPISLVAQDPAVLDRIADWGWQDGLRPAPDAPVWRMDAFRDRFLTAFGEQPVNRQHATTVSGVGARTAGRTERRTP
jgi:phosphatidylglycerophosphate synthase